MQPTQQGAWHTIGHALVLPACMFSFIERCSTALSAATTCNSAREFSHNPETPVVPFALNEGAMKPRLQVDMLCRTNTSLLVNQRVCHVHT
jgi:hypothetical protein